VLLKNNDKILFIGDSITHWYSNWATDGVDSGIGYVSMIGRALTAAYRRKGDTFQFVNRGWSGDRVGNVVDRWQKDCLDHQPDWVSLYIGINDCFLSPPTPPAQFAEQYEHLLSQGRQAGARLIVLTPFLLNEGPDQEPVRQHLDAILAAMGRLAAKYADVVVPLDPLFAAVARGQERRVWTKDGIHPTLAGHGLIADAWLKAVGAVEL
jgi:lysophospholipase L1-like esterase